MNSITIPADVFPGQVAFDTFTPAVLSARPWADEGVSFCCIGPDGAGGATIGTDAALTADQIDAIHQVAAKHQGRISRMRFHESSRLVENSRQITSSTWEVLAGVVTSPEFFCPDHLEDCLGRITGQVRVSGGSAEFRLVAQDESGADTVLTAVPLSVTDTGGSWVFLDLDSDLGLPGGRHAFRFEGQLVDGAAADVRFVSLSLLQALG